MGRAWIELATPGSAVRIASVARHVTDWGLSRNIFNWLYLCPIILLLLKHMNRLAQCIQ